jgi:amidohydrolase
MKQQILDFIDQNSADLNQLSETIFNNPELKFNEYFAVEALTNWLNENDFCVEKNVFGLETAFRAVFQNGEGGPSIGLLCEYDALEVGHACGHHMQGPIMFLAAKALKALYHDKPYKLVIYGTPAEEGGQGKRIMLEHGGFKDIDIALMNHAASNTTVDIKSLAGAKLQFEFEGKAAHEALFPELSRSAFDGMLLAFQGIEFLRGHVKDDVKFKYFIDEDKGKVKNDDTTTACCHVNIRTYHEDDVEELMDRMIAVFEGAALMTGTKVKSEKASRMKSKLPSLSLNKIMMENAEKLKAPEIIPFRKKTGSTDFGFVTHILPGAVIRYPLAPEGISTHSTEFLDYCTGEHAHNMIRLAAKILAWSMLDIIENGTTLQKVQQEFYGRKQSKQTEFELL